MRERKRKTEIREVNWLTNERERERQRSWFASKRKRSERLLEYTTIRARDLYGIENVSVRVSGVRLRLGG